MTASTSNIMDRMANHEQKQEFRILRQNQKVEFAKATGNPIVQISLPFMWEDEKQLLARCDKDGVVVGQLIGVENGIYKDGPKKGHPIYPDTVEAAPKNAIVKHDDFDYRLKMQVHLSTHDSLNHARINIVDADYMGNPAYCIRCYPYRYSYPHLETFLTFVKNAIATKTPSLYYMAFNGNCRILGGKEMIRVMGCGTTTDVLQAVRFRINLMLKASGFKVYVKEIMAGRYKGGAITQMIVLGFAIFFDPDFEKVKENLMDPRKNALKKKEKVKQEIRDLWDSATDIEKQNPKTLRKTIANELGVGIMFVSAVLAHHNNPESFK